MKVNHMEPQLILCTRDGHGVPTSYAGVFDTLCRDFPVPAQMYHAGQEVIIHCRHLPQSVDPETTV